MTKHILMMDVETLGTAHDAAVWQLSLVGVKADDPAELVAPPVMSYVPLQPQFDLVPPRTVTGATLIFWMKQNDMARMPIENCESSDFEELPAIMRHFLKGFEAMTRDCTDYELVTRGNFDAPIVEHLLRQCGLKAPWQFRNLRDLRTMMADADVDINLVPKPDGFVKHNAYWDNMFQLSCYFESLRALRSR